jgi:hypothetical protein
MHGRGGYQAANEWVLRLPSRECCASVCNDPGFRSPAAGPSSMVVNATSVHRGATFRYRYVHQYNQFSVSKSFSREGVEMWVVYTTAGAV